MLSITGEEQNVYKKERRIINRQTRRTIHNKIFPGRGFGRRSIRSIHLNGSLYAPVFYFVLFFCLFFLFLFFCEILSMPCLIKWWLLRLTLILSCSMNFHLYPHDTQQCAMKIESRKWWYKIYYIKYIKYWINWLSYIMTKSL